MNKSTPLSARKLELQQKEQMILSDMSEKGSRVKKIAMWSLAAGVIGLIGYGIYKSFTDKPEKKKKKKAKNKLLTQAHNNNEYIDKAITFGGPVLGKWILNQLEKKERVK